jgi:hypothetical protein
MLSSGPTVGAEQGGGGQPFTLGRAQLRNSTGAIGRIAVASRPRPRPEGSIDDATFADARSVL